MRVFGWVCGGVLAVGTLSSCGGPCVTCEDVSGFYSETVAMTAADESSCGTLYSTGGAVVVQLQQSGSKLSLISGSDRWTGVLNDDLSVQFDPIPGVAHDQNGGGTPIMIAIAGSFEGAKGARQLRGLYQASSQLSECITRVPVAWTQVQR